MHDTTAPRFGTDGLRGEAGVPPMDATTLARIGAALGVYLQRAGPADKRVVLGNDGRGSAEWILRALTSGLSAAEATAVDIGLVTTPALAFAARTEPFSAGIMISASHNPASDNGIKIFDHAGRKLGDDAEREIERLAVEVDFDTDHAPRTRHAPELTTRYQEFLANQFPQLDLSGQVLVVDAAHGGGSDVLPAVLRGFGAEVVVTGCAPDGNNINKDVGALHAAKLAPAVLEAKALLGICLDGDGDRGIFVDDRGEVRDGDAVMALLGPQLRAQGALPHDTVVATVMSNLGLHRCLEARGIAVHTTPVGDRSVVQAMREHGFGFGGEQSGHIIFAERGDYTGDGLLTALELLSLPDIASGSAAAFSEFHRFPQLLVNVTVRDKPALEDLDGVQQAVRDVEQALGRDGRVVLRYSGTENLCRVMVEGPAADAVQRHTEHIASAVRAAIGS